MLARLANEIYGDESKGLISGIKQLNRNMRELQEGIMSIRMVPVSFVFHRFFRIIRDLSNKLGKKIKLELEGENTELDKGLIEKISDPIMHMVRNSADHGIESPAERASKGKLEEGTITLKARHQGGNIVIEIEDDGGGLSTKKIYEKAIRENVIKESEELSDQEIQRLVFAPGFSTATEVTSISGRGVGMDVVVKNIRSLGGSVDVESEEGIGTKFLLKLPLTLAILDGLATQVEDQIYIVPLTHVVESLQPAPENIKKISNGNSVMEFRDEFIPIINLKKIFNIEASKNERKDDNILLVVENEHKKYALDIDHLIGQNQIVIKNLETNYKKIEGISGATIMGDGKVALILDVASIVNMNFK
jgi:two-component system chemotaxis sensor kinase CheA